MTVEPTPNPPTTAEHSCALILTFANSLIVLIPTLPVAVTNTCGDSLIAALSTSPNASFIISTCSSELVPIPIISVSTLEPTVATPEIVKLLRVDTPTVAFALPASVPETLPVNVP